MNVRNRITTIVFCSVIALIGTSELMQATPAVMTGAIFTTDSTCTGVNINTYDTKDAVYLDGGPAHPSAAGLPDGSYYVKVTTPAGTLLGTSLGTGTPTPVTVAGGEFAACYQLSAILKKASSGLPGYDDTTNEGGEYKVWVSSSSTFVESQSKTDNFKVRQANAAYVTVCKFNDFDGDGIHDTGEPLIAHWPIQATGVVSGTGNGQTGDSGCITFAVTAFPESGSTQTVTLSEGTFGTDWTQTAPAGNTFAVSVKAGDNVSGLEFGNHNDNCASVSCNINGLVVTKDAYPSFTRTFAWDISKNVDQTRVETSAGNATINYTVGVTHDSGTDSDWKVKGTIRVANPSPTAITGIDVSDAVDNGGSCSVTGGTAVVVSAGSHVDLPYTCTYGGSPIAGINTASAAGVNVTPASGTASVNFIGAEMTKVDDSVTISDPFGGLSVSVASTDESPQTFTYSKTVSGTSGTCKSYDNTATFTTNSTETTRFATKTVTICVGANLTVSKTASPSFKRTYNWTIGKSVDKTLVEQGGGSATFNYTVNASETGFTDSEWMVIGSITVTNPNDWEAITADVTDTINNGGVCVVNGGTSVSVPPTGSVTKNYTCTYASAPSPGSGSNTGTATWNSSAASTPSSSATGPAGADFTSVTPATVNKTITVTDTFNGGLPVTLGNLTATNVPAYAAGLYTYPHVVPNANGGTCTAYNNTALISQTGQSASQHVTICNTATGALTMGFWQNKNGQGIITGGASTGSVCNSGSWLRGYAPFQDLSSTLTTPTCAQVGTYVTNVIKAANASGAAMNAMLKAQMLATALDVYFSSAAGGNKINAVSIGGVNIDLMKVCKMIDNSSTGGGTCSGTTVNASGAFGGATSMTVSQMLAYAAGQSNSGGSAWYNQVKATQELAKNAFDAINNQAAFIAVP